MFEIKWTPEAENLYLENLEFWINHNKSNTYALKIIDEVERKEKLIADHPYIGALVEETEEEVRRVLILENFAIHYRIHESTIEVLSFWANKQNPENESV